MRKILIDRVMLPKPRSCTSLKLENRCFRRFFGQKSSTYLFRTAKSMFSTILGSKIAHLSKTTLYFNGMRLPEFELEIDVLTELQDASNIDVTNNYRMSSIQGEYKDVIEDLSKDQEFWDTVHDTCFNLRKFVCLGYYYDSNEMQDSSTEGRLFFIKSIEFTRFNDDDALRDDDDIPIAQDTKVYSFRTVAYERIETSFHNGETIIKIDEIFDTELSVFRQAQEDGLFTPLPLNTCQPNVCKCSHGLPVPYFLCSRHNSVHCQENYCNNGYSSVAGDDTLGNFYCKRDGNG